MDAISWQTAVLSDKIACQSSEGVHPAADQAAQPAGEILILGGHTPRGPAGRGRAGRAAGGEPDADPGGAAPPRGRGAGRDHPNQGARVVEYPRDELETIFELRARVEGLAARGRRRPPPALTSTGCTRSRPCCRSKPRPAAWTAVYRLNAEFHGLNRLGRQHRCSASRGRLIHASVLLRTLRLLRRGGAAAQREPPHRDRGGRCGPATATGPRRSCGAPALRPRVAAGPTQPGEDS